MIPKEKAKELIDECSQFADGLETDGCGGWEDSLRKREENGKLIAIAQIDFLLKESARTEQPVTYWKEVKQEIINL